MTIRRPSKFDQRHCLAWAALLATTFMPSLVWSAGPQATPIQKLQVLDLELQAGGRLTGAVVNPDGQPVRGGRVAVVRDGRLIASCEADAKGKFELRGLSAGLCELRLMTAQQPCRLWADGTAPPKAPRELLLVAGQPTERGQRPIGDIVRNPIVIGLIIAAAVAIPIATHDRSGS